MSEPPWEIAEPVQPWTVPSPGAQGDRMPVRGGHLVIHRGARAEADGDRIVVRGADRPAVEALTGRLLGAMGARPPAEIDVRAHEGYLVVSLGPGGGAPAPAHLEAVAREVDLPARTHAQQVLRERITAGEGVALALCDLDKTQCINDVYGRALTEEVVRRIFDPARTVCEARGAHPFMYLSGDEFGVIGAPGASPPRLRQTLEAVQQAFVEVEQRLRVVVMDEVRADELDEIVAACPRVLAAALHGRLGCGNVLVDVQGLPRPDEIHRGLADEASRALGRPLQTSPHWFNYGRFWVPSFTAGGIRLTAEELTALGLTAADPEAAFAALLTRAGLMCRLAKRRRGSVLIAASEAEHVRRASVFPPPRPVTRPGVTIPDTFPADGEADPITGLLRQATLEREVLPRCFDDGDGVYLEISDISYRSPLFVEEEHKAIKWGPVYDGAVLGARIMAINEFYGYEAGNNSVKLVGRSARQALPESWRASARIARKSPDKIQVVLPVCPSVDEVLDVLDRFQAIHGQQLSEELSVRARAVMIPLANARSVPQVIDDIEPLRLMTKGVPTYRTPQERAHPGTGSFLVVYDVARDDAEGRARFEREYRAMQDETSKQVAQEILLSAPGRGRA